MKDEIKSSETIDTAAMFSELVKDSQTITSKNWPTWNMTCYDKVQLPCGRIAELKMELTCDKRDWEDTEY